jgi:hypothetical protein
MAVPALILSSFACAQESVNNASISGRVTDPSGAVVQGAQITARQTETNLARTATADSEGRFRIPYLHVGNYEVTITKQGFGEARRTLTLSAGSAFELPVQLTVASNNAAVTVNSQAEVLETARTQLAGTVPQAEVNQIPLNGRNFLDVALLVPGVSPTNTQANQLFAETSAVPGQGISVSSQRNFSNSFIVDGVSNNDDAAGVTGAFYGLDVIQEFQVVTSGGQAEFGRALGGYVNMVTRSGGNTVHGDGYLYFRNQRLDAANALSHTALPITEAQYGASAGGPIVRNKTFYFANFEQRELNQSGLTTILPANVAIINAHLLAVDYPGPLISTGIYSNPVHNSNVFAKVDHQFSDHDQFNIRYSFYDVNAIHSRGAGGLSASTASANLHDNDQSVAASNIWTIAPNLVNETRGQYWYSSLTAPPSDQIGPAVSISGVASFGTLSGSPTGRLNKLGEVVDSVAYQTGAHAIRAGFEYLYNDDTITFPRTFRGSYSFSSLANFLAGTYNSSGFTQTFANSVVNQTNPNAGFYAQDEWRVNPRLTLNAGVRYDLEFLKTIDTQTGNVSPRGGFAWTPFRSRTTVIRGGYGLFYDRIPLRPLANALLSANNTTNPADLSQISISLSPGQAGAPVFPNILGALTIPPGVLFNFSTMSRNMKNAYAEQGNFEVEHQFGKNTTIEVGYEYLRGLHLIASVNQNVPTCTASGTNDGCRPNLTYGNDSQYSPAADSNYNGLHVSFIERPVTWGNFRVSYTYSRALDDVSEFFFSAPMNNYNIWQDYARSDDDQKFRLVWDGTVHTPLSKGNTTWQKFSHGFQLTAMMQYYSALPFNITTGANTIQGTAARPAIGGVFIGRNVGNGFDFFNTSARLSRVFDLTERLRLQAMIEGFNLTNHVNGVTLNGVFGTGAFPTNPSSTFKQITAVDDPRSFQLAIKLSF